MRVFVAAEFAIVGAPKTSIDKKAADGNRLARVVQSVLRNPQKQDRYIATAQLGITVASLGLGMYGEHVLADGIYHYLGASGGPAFLVSHTFASVVAVAILTYFHIVVGEMVPKSLALQRAETMVLWITPPMLWTKNVLYPFVVGLNGLGNLTLRMMGVQRQVSHAEQYYTPEELSLIVQESEELGALRTDSSQVLQELFEFGDLTADQVMVPRVRVTGIALDSTADEIRDVLGSSPHTRYPVFEQDLDHIVGMIHIKDALRLLLNNETLAQEHVRPLPLMPETAELDDVLDDDAARTDADGGRPRRARRNRRYRHARGPVRGSRRRDRGEPARRAAVSTATPSGRLRVPGTMRVDEVGQQFNLDLEHEEVDSVSGLVLTLLGRTPVVGDTVRYERLEFEVTAVKGHGVDECAVCLLD